MKRLFILILSLVCTMGLFAYAADAGPRHPEHPVALPVQMPAWNKHYQAYGNITETSEANAPPNNDTSSMSVTVTAVVLPARIIIVHEKTITMTSNTASNSLFLVQDEAGRALKLTPELWQTARVCMLNATKSTGISVCQADFIQKTK